MKFIIIGIYFATLRECGSWYPSWVLWKVHLNSNLLFLFPAYRKIWNEENIKSIHQIPAMYEISVILIDMKYSVQIGIWKFYPWWVGPWSFLFRVLFGIYRSFSLDRLSKLDQECDWQIFYWKTVYPNNDHLNMI